MFVDFNTVFNNKPNPEVKIPNVVLSKLSENLPDGIQYEDMGNGYLVMRSESGSMMLGGFSVVIPETFKEILGNNSTQGNLMQLSYNSQTPLELRLKHDGFIIVNGEEMPFGNVCYNIFYDVKLEGNKMIAYPWKFPEPFEISASTEDEKYERRLTMHREPYLSLDKMSFKSEDKQPLQLEVITSADNGGGTITANLRLKYASTIRDIVESAFIFNDFADGKLKFDRHAFRCEFPKGSIKKFNPKTVAFWEKVLRVEEHLGIHFMVPEGDTEYLEICDVEMLYRNLICKVPIRENRRLESATGNFNYNNIDKTMDELKNTKNLYFQYQTTYEMDLFGQNIKLPALCGMFKSTVKKIEKVDNDNVRIDFMDKDPNDPSYTSVLCFKDEESLRLFEDEKKKDGGLDRVLEDAKLVGAYLN